MPLAAGPGRGKKADDGRWRNPQRERPFGRVRRVLGSYDSRGFLFGGTISLTSSTLRIAADSALSKGSAFMVRGYGHRKQARNE